MYTSYNRVATTFTDFTDTDKWQKTKTIYAYRTQVQKVILIQAVGDLERKGLLAAIA